MRKIRNERQKYKKKHRMENLTISIINVIIKGRDENEILRIKAITFDDLDISSSHRMAVASSKKRKKKNPYSHTVSDTQTDTHTHARLQFREDYLL